MGRMSLVLITLNRTVKMYSHTAPVSPPFRSTATDDCTLSRFIFLSPFFSESEQHVGAIAGGVAGGVILCFVVAVAVTPIVVR